MSIAGYLAYIYKNRAILRSPEAYTEFVRKCGAAPETAYFLKNSAQAGAYPAGPDGGWRYVFARRPEHDQLQATYHLHDLAGQGGAFTRALRVMDWFCKHTWYNGMSVWSSWRFRLFGSRREESAALMRYVYDGPFSRSINCRHKAFILADLLRAVGLYAFPVAMLNYSYGSDETPVTSAPCHLTVQLWLPEESRWVMLDPSFNSYITDGNGRVLGLTDIQAKHCAGEDLCLGQYDFNGTQACRKEYLESFVLGSLLELLPMGRAEKKNLRYEPLGSLVPEHAKPSNEKLRQITLAEFLASPAPNEKES